jgi:hypothetical protein
MAKPVIVLVPGAFCPAHMYDMIVSGAAEKGVQVDALDMPSVGPRDGPLPTMYDDAAFIASHVTRLADSGKDVILLAHSYGGVPTTQSTKGLTKKERAANGKKGGIVRLAYMTAVIGDVGDSAGSVLANRPEEAKTKSVPDVSLRR